MLTPQETRKIIQDLMYRHIIWITFELISILNFNAVRYICGYKTDKQFYLWKNRKASPTIDQEIRLRCAYEAVKLIQSEFGKDTAISWLMGMNTILDNESPLKTLREVKNLDKLYAVVGAAKSFVFAR